MQKYAIIGFGCAGYHAAKSIRMLDRDGAIDVYSDHADPPYNPMLTTYRAGGKLSHEKMFPFGTLEEISQALSLRVHTNSVVERLNLPAREVVLRDGGKAVYDRILLATGARAVIPNLPGMEGDRIYFMRTQADADRLSVLLAHPCISSAVVVGASMVGIKVAEVLRDGGIHTTLMDMAPFLFPLSAYRDVAEMIRARVEAGGVRLALGAGLAAVDHRPDGLAVHLTDGSTLETDIVVLCIGTRPNLELLDRREIDIGRAVRVNARMETSVQGVYAAGDCCEGMDLQSGDTKIIGLWANAGQQGSAAGRNMAGDQCVFRGNILHNITHFMGMDFIGLGDSQAEGEPLLFGDPEGNGLYIKAVLQTDRLVGVNILNNVQISGIMKNYFIRRLGGSAQRVAPVQKELLIKEGLPRKLIDRLEGQAK